MNSRMPTAVTIGKKDGKSTWKHHEYNRGKDIVIQGEETEQSSHEVHAYYNHHGHSSGVETDAFTNSDSD
jgi:hypothetical protein